MNITEYQPDNLILFDPAERERINIYMPGIIEEVFPGHVILKGEIKKELNRCAGIKLDRSWFRFYKFEINAARTQWELKTEDGIFAIARISETKYKHSGSGIIIRYVHELQNIFRKEINIELINVHGS